MRPAPIPDDQIWEGARRIVLGPPDGDITGIVAPVEALVDCAPTLAAHRISVRCVPEEGDLDALLAGASLWISFLGAGMPPVFLQVLPDPGAADPMQGLDPSAVPGWEGTRGPHRFQRDLPHVYARDIDSGAGNCVCGRGLGARLHVQAAPGVPIPPRMRT